MSDNVAKIESLLDALEAADLDKIVMDFAPDITVHEPANLPYGGPHVGVDAFKNLLMTIFQLGDVALTKREVVQAGERVLVNMFVDFTNRSTGRTLSTSMAEIYTLREGKIVEIDVYYKDVTALSVLFSER